MNTTFPKAFKILPKATKCPVCDMWVDMEDCEFTNEEDGVKHYFCADSCRHAFLENRCCLNKPKKGWWGRFLDRMDQSNRGSFGPSGPKCH